jgi:hypothetical protein
MKPLELPALTAEQAAMVATLYRTTHNVRLRTRAQMVWRRPRSLDLLYSTWTLQRLADELAERTGIRVREQKRCGSTSKKPRSC